VDNRAEDHFLRVCIPTGIDAACAHVDANLDVNAYPTRPGRDGEFRAQDLARHRQHLFVDLGGEHGGFAILNDAVRDYEVVDADTGTVALSMVRGVRLRIPCDNRLWMEYPGDDSAQSPGRHTAGYALYPHEGDWREGSVYRQALAFNTPLRVAQIGPQDGILPSSRSFVEISAEDAVLSCVKKAEDRDSLIVRMFNPSPDDVDAALSFPGDVAEAWLVNLDEDRLEQVKTGGNGEVHVNLAAGKIVGVDVVFAGQHGAGKGVAQ